MTKNCCGVLVTNGKEEKWYVRNLCIVVAPMPKLFPLFSHKN
jgi:hypothetical protein